MFLYVANWKMNLSFYEAGELCVENYQEFQDLSELPGKKVVLCPSYINLIPTLGLFEDCCDEVEIGAQNCSAYEFGPYTGQVSAASLAEVGCTYCIVGHSEVREHFSEGDQEVAEKVVRLLENNIIPILCIGERKELYSLNTAKEFLLSQLEPVFKRIKGWGDMQLCIAYEPIWSIGTGITPEIEYIEKIFEYIFEIGKKMAPNAEIALLYGGSVNENNVKNMKSIANLGGFLIGSASLDFKKFEKIVQL